MELDLDKEILMNPSNKIYLLLLIFAMIFLFIDVEAQTWTGSGTKADPYIIDTYQELLDLDNNTYYVMDGGVFFALGADIDCTWDSTGTNHWNPIDGTGTESWRNHLDGRGYTIKNLDFDWGLTVGASTDQYIGMFRTLNWKTTPTAADTVDPIIKNIVFDSTRIGGTWSANFFNADLLFGIITPVINNTAIVTNTNALDSVIIRNTQYRSHIQSVFTEAMCGEAVGLLSTAARANRVFVENSNIVISRDGTTNDYTSSYRANNVGGIFGATYTNSVISNSGYEGHISVHEGTGSGGANGIIAVGAISAVAHYHQEWYDVYAQVGITMTSDVTAASRVGGLVGVCDDVIGTANTIVSNGVYVVVDSLLLSSNDVFGHVFSLERNDFWQAYNTFADTTLISENDIGWKAGVSNSIFQGDASGSPAYGQLYTEVGKTTSWMKTQSNYETESPLTNGYPFDFVSIWTIASGEYPTFQYNGIAASITILSPSDLSNQIYPITVNWTGVGNNYDSSYIYLNDVLSDSVSTDTTYSITTGATGSLEIKIVARADATIKDSVTVTAFRQGQLSLDSGYVSNDSLYYKITAVNLLDTLDFYVGNDTITSGMTTVSSLYMGSGIVSTTYGFTKPSGFFGGQGGVPIWFKIETTEDSTDNYTIASLNYVGQLGGTQICWIPSQSLPIEVLGIKDISCGWVGGITKQYTATRLNIGQTGQPTITISSNACSPPYTSCTWAEATFQAMDTTGGGTTVTTEKYSQITAYLQTGNPITINSRNYYISNEKLYMDDLANSIDSTVIYDLSTYYSSADMISPSLWIFPYKTGITDTIRHDGTIDTELPARDTTLIIIYEPSDFQRMWSFNAFPTPPAYSEVFSDTYSVSAVLNATRTYFRGIDPAFNRVR